MTKRKFTDEEVIKGLKLWCYQKCADCCDRASTRCNSCAVTAVKQALDLINRQRAEIEQLKDIIKQYEQACEESRKEHAHQMELLDKMQSMIMGGQCTSSVGGEGEESD